MRAFACLLILLAGCTAQQGRHAIDARPLAPPTERDAPPGRTLDDFTDIEAWALYPVQGSINPLAREAADDGVRLTSDSSAGLVWREVGFDPSAEPLLAWRWRVSEVFDGASPLSPEFDNFPARLLVGFDSGWDGAGPAALSWRRRVEEFTGVTPPARAICYTFGGGLSSREAVDAAFGEGRIVVINLRSPRAEAGRWHHEVRDVAADYLAVFREEPPPVTALALGSDSHRVKRRVWAEFADLMVYGPEGRSYFARDLGPTPTRRAPTLAWLIIAACMTVAAGCVGVWVWGLRRESQRFPARKARP